MKTLVSLLLLFVFFSACSQKLISIKPKCRNLENKIIKLKNDKYISVVREVVNIPITGYPLNKNNTESQNLKVLEMRLNECNQNRNHSPIDK